MKNYTVVKEDGITLDDVLFIKDEVLELDPEADTTKALVAEGFIVEDESEITMDEVGGTTTAPSEVEAEKVLYYNGNKVSGEVTEEVTDGITYKVFSDEAGTSYKLTSEDFDAQTELK